MFEPKVLRFGAWVKFSRSEKVGFKICTVNSNFCGIFLQLTSRAFRNTIIKYFLIHYFSGNSDHLVDSLPEKYSIKNYLIVVFWIAPNLRCRTTLKIVVYTAEFLFYRRETVARQNQILSNVVKRCLYFFFNKTKRLEIVMFFFLECRFLKIKACYTFTGTWTGHPVYLCVRLSVYLERWNSLCACCLWITSWQRSCFAMRAICQVYCSERTEHAGLSHTELLSTYERQTLSSSDTLEPSPCQKESAGGREKEREKERSRVARSLIHNRSLASWGSDGISDNGELTVIYGQRQLTEKNVIPRLNRYSNCRNLQKWIFHSWIIFVRDKQIRIRSKISSLK